MKEQEQIVILSESRFNREKSKNLMPNGLTTHPFPPKLGREGEIFMAEPVGNGEILGKAGPGPQKPLEGVVPQKETNPQQDVVPGPQVSSQAELAKLNAFMRILGKLSPDSGSKDKKEKEKARKVSPEEARKAWMEHYKGRELKGEELKTVNWLINLGITPESQGTPQAKSAFEQAADYLLSPEINRQFQRETKELTKQVPEFGIVAQKRKEAGEEGMPEKNRARMLLDTTDITDPTLREQVNLINNMVTRMVIRRPDGSPEEHERFDTDFLARRLEHIYDLPIPADQNQQDQLARIKQRITDLISDQRDLENQIRAEQIRAEQSSQRRYRSYWSEQEENDIDNPDKKEEREKIFEEIFIGADSSPGTEWNEAFSLEARSKWDNFISRVSKVPLVGENLTREFSARFEARKILHNSNWGVSGGGNIQVFAQAAGTYKDEYTDLIFQDPLVESALHFFEQGFQQIKADNNGHLPYEKLEWNFNRKKLNPETGRLEDKPGSDLEDIVHEQLISAIHQGAIKERDGTPLSLPAQWRIQRAIVLARGFGVLSLRFPEIAAEARLPEQTVLSDANVGAHRTASIYGEAVGKYLDPLEHLIEKFSIGLEDRAILYFFLTGDKRRFASKEQLEVALRMKSQLRSGDKRVIDLINFFRTGGPFSHSSWRQRVAFEQLEGEEDDHYRKRLERSGIGVLEARAEGDVDDKIKNDIKPEFREELKRRRPALAAQSDQKIDRLIESDYKLSEEFIKLAEDKANERVEGFEPRETMKYKERLLMEKRLEMWKNALKTNPLRVMWEWENKEREINKNPGQRIRFLAEALGVSQDEAKGLIGQVEKDLMIVQEDFVSSRKPIDENNENLDFEVIGRDTEDDSITGNDRIMERRENVRKYVDYIRAQAKGPNNDYRFFKDVLLKYTSVTGDPGIDTPFPFVVGFDDIPFGEFDFIKSGGRGLSRKINDFASAANASTELINLLNGIGKAQTIDPLIGHLVAIKEALSNVDADLAQQLIEPLAEGIIRIYKKDPLAKLPLGIGTFIGLTGDTSFAQKHKGMGAMSLDETDIYNFTKHLTQNSLVSMEKIEKLRWKIGGTFFHAGLDFVRTYLQLLLLIMAIEFATRTAQGK